MAYCNEFYFGFSLQVTLRVKRRSSKHKRYKKRNVHFKKTTTKDEKVAACKEGYELLLNVFVVVGEGYKKVILYEVPNSVRKMTTKVYTTVVFS